MTSTGRYRHLFTPMRIGPVVVPNRIVFAAHLTNYAEGGLPTEQHAAYYGARAAGGAGLVITEEHSTHPTDWPYEKLIHGFNPAVVDGYRRITDAVHAHDVPVFAQINHNGGQASGLYSRLPVWAPSPIPDPLFREVPKAVERHEIAAIIEGYATVANRCTNGGFDGIELQCSHSSIVRGFLSPATNHRDDDYGGTFPAAPGCSSRSWRRCARPSAPTTPSASACAATSSSRGEPGSPTPSRWPAWSSGPDRSTTSTPRSEWPRPPSS